MNITIHRRLTPGGNLVFVGDCSWLTWNGYYVAPDGSKYEAARTCCRWMNDYHEELGIECEHLLALIEGQTVRWERVDCSLGTYRIKLIFSGGAYGCHKVSRRLRLRRDEVVSACRHAREREAAVEVFSLDGRQEEVEDIVREVMK